MDDCSRLRDVIKALPVTRRFIPSLLVISWTEEESHLASDFFDMVGYFCLVHKDENLINFCYQVKKLVGDSVLQSYHVFAITSATKDLDNKLSDALQSLNLDLEGKLVQTMSLKGVFKLFEPAFNPFLSEWIEHCSTNGACE